MHQNCMVSVIRLSCINLPYFYFYTHHTPLVILPPYIAPPRARAAILHTVNPATSTGSNLGQALAKPVLLDELDRDI